MMPTQQVAAALGITRPGVLKAIGRGQLVARRFGRDWIVNEQDVETYRAVHLGKRGRPKNES